VEVHVEELECGPPANKTPPSIKGAPQQGQTLTEVHGSWTNEPTTFKYQWLQCNSSGEGCFPIAGATSQTYVPMLADIYNTIRVQETASNARGSSAPATSAATATVAQGKEPALIGNVAAWGVGDQYELGALWASEPNHGSAWPVGSAVTGVAGVASGYHGSYALMPNGTVLSWGGDGLYQLGHGWHAKPITIEGKQFEPPPSESEGRSEARSPRARPVVGPDWTPLKKTVLGERAGEKVTSIAATGPSALALLEDGEVRAWGGLQGCGCGREETAKGEVPEVNSTSVPLSPLMSGNSQTEGPRLGVSTAPIVGIGVGPGQGAATRFAITSLANGGKVYGWGSTQAAKFSEGGRPEYVGNLGANASGSVVINPVEIAGISNCIAVAAGEYHTLFLIKEPSGATLIKAIGSNKEGQLGTGSTTSPTHSLLPVTVQLPASVNRVIQIAASEFASFALVETTGGEDEVLAWGRNNSGELGNGTSGGESATPTKVHGPEGGENFPQPIKLIHAGRFYAEAIAGEGKLFAWGGNGIVDKTTETVINGGQIGDGTEEAKPTPVKVKQWDGTPLPSKVLSVSGYEHPVAVLEGTRPPRVMTATLENRETPSQQLTLTWQTPGEANIQLRIVATEQVEPWEPQLTYNVNERVEDSGTYFIARVTNTGERPAEHPSVWESGAAATPRKAKSNPEASARSSTFALPFVLHNPYYEVILEQQSAHGTGVWGFKKKVNTQWLP
jgi:alpha-tubulin suppressor-like RCC1 family protein